jgi:hypothetical protein
MNTTAKSGFTTFEAARNELKAAGFTSVGPYAKDWTGPNGEIFSIGGGLKGKTGQSARGLAWTYGYFPKAGA